MNFPKLITNIILGLIAAVITVLISLTLPQHQFAHYRLELDSTWVKEADVQDYLVDLNNDYSYEIIRHKDINKPGHSMELIRNNHLSVIGIFGETAFIVSRFVRFADVNQDGVKELVFIAVDGRKASLFIMEFDFESGKNPPVKNIQKIEIDSVSYQNNVPDVINFDILTSKSDIYFDLQAGYSVYPRNVYKYNFITQKLDKTPRNSIVNKELELLTHHQQDYLLAKEVVVTANTYTREQTEKYRISKNADTAKIYRHIKNLIFQYGDFSSYVLLYNKHLDFAFPPIAFPGWTNYTLSGFLWNDTIPEIISLTNNQLDDTNQRKLSLCNLSGDLLKQVAAAENYEHLYADSNTFALHFSQKLDIYSSDLNLMKRLTDLTFASGFYDLTRNASREFIAFENNQLAVFSENFSRKTSFDIAQEFAPYPENNNIEVLSKGEKTSFLFNTRLFYYLFSYEKNEWALLKYPFYIVIFLFWSGILFFLLRFNARRLEKEKQQLEKIVLERTIELRLKNKELASQKEEILLQAGKISEQYVHLEKLHQFKESLTHALVHDLKNPLSQILLSTGNLWVNQPARKMLRLVMNMLDVEKYENTEFKLNKEIHSLRGMFHEATTGQEISLREKNLAVHLHFSDFLVLADSDVLVRVIDNLLANAIRFSPQNMNIDVYAEKDSDDIIHVAIKNYGEPIPEEAMPYIFDKYRQFHKADSKAHQSTGLGLTFCKMALEAHAQKIVAENATDGVLFSFTLTGKLSQSPVDVPEKATPEILLSNEEIELLKPFFERLRHIDVHQVSDIWRVLNEMPGDSASINAVRQQIRDATYAVNGDLYQQLINL